jgi:hypothetical protein
MPACDDVSFSLYTTLIRGDCMRLIEAASDLGSRDPLNEEGAEGLIGGVWRWKVRGGLGQGPLVFSLYW